MLITTSHAFPKHYSILKNCDWDQCPPCSSSRSALASQVSSQNPFFAANCPPIPLLVPLTMGCYVVLPHTDCPSLSTYDNSARGSKNRSSSVNGLFADSLRRRKGRVAARSQRRFAGADRAGFVSRWIMFARRRRLLLAGSRGVRGRHGLIAGGSRLVLRHLHLLLSQQHRP